MCGKRFRYGMAGTFIENLASLLLLTDGEMIALPKHTRPKGQGLVGPLGSNFGLAMMP